MIAFPCEKCGKRFDRPDATAGSLVWCACGARNVVPWESSLPPAPPAPERPPAPPLAIPQWVGWDKPAPARRERFANFCFNHQETPIRESCAACREGFCADCVVSFQGRSLCAPCKNYAVRRLQKPPRITALAILAPVVALVLGPLGMLLLGPLAGAILTRGPGNDVLGVFLVVAVLALGAQLAALVMSVLALRKVEGSAGLGGRAWAITGMVGAAIGIILIGELTWLVLRATGRD